jgi:hypothetical protein
METGLMQSVDRITYCGPDRPTRLMPGYVHVDGRDLPFRDGSFDLGFSRAVMEHVGGEADQRAFLVEHARASAGGDDTETCVPLEVHSLTLMLRHWSRSWSHVDRRVTPAELRESRRHLGVGSGDPRLLDPSGGHHLSRDRSTRH